MVEYNGIMCIEASELMRLGIVSKPYYDALIHRKQMRVVRRGGGGHPALVEYATMPASVKERVISTLGNPEADGGSMTFADSIKKDGEAVKYYAAHRFTDEETGMSVGLRPERQAE